MPLFVFCLKPNQQITLLWGRHITAGEEGCGKIHKKERLMGRGSKQKMETGVVCKNLCVWSPS